MKKYLALLLVAVFVTALFAGCKSGTTNAAVKTGYAVITSLSKSTDAGEAEGLAQSDSTVVAVTVDAEGKVVKCVIDAAQNKINFSATGEITTPMDTIFPSKDELGEGYGMKAASGIGKEWNEQTAALAAYFVGKTAAEIKNIAVDEEMHATGSDLTSSVTISIGGYLAAVDKAIANATDMGAKANDELGLGIVTNMSHSANVGEEDGVAQAYSTYVVLTKDANGKITSCIIDASQSNVNFDATGKITTDLTVAPPTKDELGEGYGMKAASGIGKEWNEQAAAFAAYVTGKTATEVASIAVDEEGSATGSDLTSSVTIGIGDFQAALAKAAA